MPLTEENIKAELSYAYVHAIASRSGFSCGVGGRHDDNAGIDAKISEYGRLAPDSVLTDFCLHVQLKATSRPCRSPRGRPDRISFDLELAHYEKLRKTSTESQMILVVLFLPPSSHRWLNHSESSVIARRCAYWVSLRGAPASGNNGSQVVYIPRANVFSAEALTQLMVQLSREDRVAYGY